MKQYYRFYGVLSCLVILFGVLICGMQNDSKESVVETQTDAISEVTKEQVAVKDSENKSIRVSELVYVGEAQIFIETGEEVSAASDTEQEQESEYTNFAIADVNQYVNVRNKPSTEGEIVGKMYDGAVAQILATAGEDDDWFQITSGNVEGYIKAEFFIYGDDAAAVMDEYVTRYAQVQVDRLNVRPGASTEENRIGYIDKGEKVKVLEDCGEWLRVQYTDQKEGYVCAEYVNVLEEYIYAKTLEEERAEMAKKESREERKNVSVEEKPETITDIVLPSSNYTSNVELRNAIVAHAMQYVGNRYVSGGSSLAGGTDCSGFTCFVYADFGYLLSRTPGGQLAGAGRSIDYANIQPGDIICYSSNGGKSCTHVALYIGNGQIVHAKNSRDGVCVSMAGFEPIIGIKNVID